MLALYRLLNIFFGGGIFLYIKTCILNHSIIGTINLRRWQIFTISDPPQSGFFTTIYRQIWQISDPSSPKKWSHTIKSVCFDFYSTNLGSLVIKTGRSEDSLLPPYRFRRLLKEYYLCSLFSNTLFIRKQNGSELQFLICI